MGVKHLVVAALEIRRRYSEAGAVHIDPQREVQRQRSANRDWQDWAAWFLRPLDFMTPEERDCVLAFFEEPDGWEWTSRAMCVADDALQKFEDGVHPSLIRQGELIASRL